MSIAAFDHDLSSIQEMRRAVQKAKEAQKEYNNFTQEQVDRIVKNAADAAFRKAEELGRLAVEETGMGVALHKKIKNEVGSRDVYESIRSEKTVGVINEDRVKKVVEIATPFGVIAGIVPTTNPTSTAIFKSLIALKTRNAIVFSPHPSAVKCTVKALEICHQAAVEAGAPEGIIGWMTQPTMPATEGLMHHKDINLILATGGGGLVRAAYSSGKPAYGVGPGNVPVYIEKSAQVKDAVRRIVASKTFDNGTICATEQAMIVDENIKELVMKELKNNGAYFLHGEEKKMMEQTISPIPRKLNPKIVGKSAVRIAEMAGITVPSETKLLVAEETEVGKEYPFSIEKLSPIFALYTVKGHHEALILAERLLDLGGRGHTLSLHTNDEKVAKEFALHMPVSRILVNTPSALGAVGGTTGLMPSMTLGCGSFGGNITSDNITARHLLNIKRMAYGLKDVEIPKAEESVKNTQPELKINDVVAEVLKQVKHSNVDSKAVAEIVNEVIMHYQNK